MKQTTRLKVWGKTGIHENDKNHLLAAERTYLSLVDAFPYWKKIDCFKDDKILSRAAIEDVVWGKMQQILTS